MKKKRKNRLEFCFTLFRFEAKLLNRSEAKNLKRKKAKKAKKLRKNAKNCVKKAKKSEKIDLNFASLCFFRSKNYSSEAKRKI